MPAKIRDERRQYFSLTSLGAKVARAEVKRLEALVVDPRARRLLKGSLTMTTSHSFYRLLLRLCPPDLRAEFGAEMEALFLADRCARPRSRQTARVGARDRRRDPSRPRRAQDSLAHAFGTTSAYVEYETGRILDGYASIRSAARDARDGAAARHQPRSSC